MSDSAIRRLGYIAVAAIVVMSTAVQGEDLHEDLEFARGLQERGYDSLAVDQLQRTRERDDLSEDVRLESVKMLARLYRQIGQEAADQRDFSDKRENYLEALDEYSRYIELKGEDELDDEELHDLLYERGELRADLASDNLEGMKGSSDQEEREEYRENAIEWFKRAREDLKKAKDFYVDLRDTLEEAKETDEEKREWRQVREEAGRIQMEYGKMLYEYSDAYVGAEDTVDDVEERREALLDETIEIFENMAKTYRLLAIRYRAYRQIGRCYRKLGSFEKSIEYLDRAIRIERTSETEWIIWRARYDLAKTYNAWGEEKPEKYEDAITAVSALVNEIHERAEVSGNQALTDLLFAGWLERGKALVGNAERLLKLAEEAREKDRKAMARDRTDQAKNGLRWAVERAQEISAQGESKWARNAKMHLDEWIEKSEELFDEEIQIRKDINAYMSEGWRAFEEEKYIKAIDKFKQAIRVGDPSVYGSTLIPEAWYKMGLSYYKLSAPEHTENKYNYYHEAALCFNEIVQHHSKAEFAADAGYYAMQLYGAIFDRTRKLADGSKRNEADKRFDGRRYYEALQKFSEEFPKDRRAGETIFQSAEIAREMEDYDRAAEIYASINQDHSEFYEARYRAGLCRYLQGLKIFEENEDDIPEEKVADLLQRAGDRYEDFIEWYDQNEDWLDSEGREMANRWVVRTKVSYGKMLVHRAWGETRDEAEGAERALDLLEDVEEEHFTDDQSEDLRDEYLPEAYFVVIQAHRRLEELREAEEFVDALVERYGEHEISARAARYLGYAYLQRRENLEEEEASETDIELAAQSAGEYLKTALDLDPDQTLEFYNDTALQLYDMEEYKQAIRILEAGLEQFPLPEDELPGEQHMLALTGIKDAYRKREEWQEVENTVERLLDIEEKENKRREEEGKKSRQNIAYRRDYALALEEQEKWKEALDYWREAKSLAENMEDERGERIQFDATTSIARCYAEMGGADNRDRGYRVLAWYLLSNDEWLRDREWAEEVEEIFEEYFSDQFDDLAEYTFQLIQGDINLLREDTSREVIVGLVERHWADREEELEELLDEADVELGTTQ